MKNDKIKVKILLVMICVIGLVMIGIFMYNKYIDNQKPIQSITYNKKYIEEFNLENKYDYTYLIYYNTLSKEYYLGRFGSMRGKYGTVLETEYNLGKNAANFGEYKDGTVEIIFETKTILFDEKGIKTQMEEKNEIATFGLLGDYIYEVENDDPVVQLHSIKLGQMVGDIINLTNMNYKIPIDLLSPQMIDKNL